MANGDAIAFLSGICAGLSVCVILLSIAVMRLRTSIAEARTLVRSAMISSEIACDGVRFIIAADAQRARLARGEEAAADAPAMN